MDPKIAKDTMKEFVYWMMKYDPHKCDKMKYLLESGKIKYKIYRDVVAGAFSPKSVDVKELPIYKSLQAFYESYNRQALQTFLQQNPNLLLPNISFDQFE